MKPGTLASDLELARWLLVELLSDGTPVVGARLKQLLSRRYESYTGRRFNEAAWGYRKFSDFLSANPDLVEIRSPQEHTDVSVVLRPGVQKATAVSAARFTEDAAKPKLPGQLWQAFTNPDPGRKRFFHRRTHRIAHFVTGQDDDLNTGVERAVAGDRDYVEVEFVPGPRHLAWMKEFLDSIVIPDSQRQVFDKLVKEPYTTASNVIFTQALGPFGGGWRRFRSEKLHEVIRAWAEKNGIAVGDLVSPAGDPTEAAGEVAAQAPGLPVSKDYAELRRYLHMAVDALEGTELDKVLVPASLLQRLVATTRRGE